jgi:uncharacterized protein (TIGR02118 family)
LVRAAPRSKSQSALAPCGAPNQDQEERNGSACCDVQTPTDAAAFDKHYFEKHVPLAKKIRGLRKYDVSKGGVGTPFGPSAYHLVAILEFDDLAAIQAAFASAEGQAAAADVQTFATGGVELFMFDTREV